MKKIFCARWMTLLVLVLIFIAPGLVAYEYYVHRPQSILTTNQGRLLRPPVLLTLPFSGARWRMVLWRPHGCKHACARQLDHLARVRLALGRHLYNVDVVLLISSQHKLNTWQKEHKTLSKRMQEHGLLTMMASKDDLELRAVFGDTSGVFLVSPHKYAILAYPARNFSDAIFHDLKHILSNE